MQYVIPGSPAEVVAAGAQLLDERMPGWWRLISLEELHLSSCDGCICGQLAETALVMSSTPAELTFLNRYSKTLRFLKLSRTDQEEMRSELGYDFDYGFNVMDWTECEDELTVDEWAVLTGPTYVALEEEWKLVITARLEADVLSRDKAKPPAEAPVLTPA